MINTMMRCIANRIMTRRADFCIGPDAHDPYMLRWHVLPKNRLLNVYLHWIRHSDDDRALHDHPWASISYMIAGELVEVYRNSVCPNCFKHQCREIPSCPPTRELNRTIKTGQWVYRQAAFAHRLLVVPASDGALTLFITGPKIRSWGFLCPNGWRHWRDFVDPDNPGAPGRGCGEE